jgi:hypothetical protein
MLAFAVSPYTVFAFICSYIYLFIFGWSLSECGGVEDDSLLPFMVLVDGT